MHTVNYKALLTSAGEGAHGGFRKWEIITESPVLITGFGASEAKQFSVWKLQISLPRAVEFHKFQTK